MKRSLLIIVLLLAPLGAQQSISPGPSRKFINASGSGINIKASAGVLYGFCLTNETSSVEYVEFFNSASAPTLGTTAVDHAIKIPASGNVCPGPFNVGTTFSAGIGFASVTAENGSSTASVTGVIFYE